MIPATKVQFLSETTEKISFFIRPQRNKSPSQSVNYQ